MSRSTTEETPEPVTNIAERRKPIMVSLEEACRMISVSRMTMHTLVQSGKIASKYHGRRRLVVYASLEEFADNLPTQKAGSE